jgi:hypothetical protein
MVWPAFEPNVALWYSYGRHDLRSPLAFDLEERAK